ncbi:MAG: hypothetical protein HS106_11945 [Ideonella sp.]|nr:hypothetical protein [Ideonella sp.]
MVWAFGGRPLADPQATALWSIVAALAAALAPAPMIGVFALLVCLPLTLTWIGCVILTGSGPFFAGSCRRHRVAFGGRRGGV